MSILRAQGCGFNKEQAVMALNSYFKYHFNCELEWDSSFKRHFICTSDNVYRYVRVFNQGNVYKAVVAISDILDQDGNKKED